MKIAIIMAMYNMDHFNNSYDNIILDCSRLKKKHNNSNAKKRTMLNRN
jgi:hypothetical protein